MRVVFPLVALASWIALSGPAQASPALGMPEVSHGSNPYRSFVGNVGDGGTDLLLDIPEGQDFIITMFYDYSSKDLEVLRDGIAVLTLPQVYGNYTATGLARLRVEGGATLSVRRAPAWGSGQYYLQGYLVQTGSPERFVSGTTPGGGTHTVWTSDSDRDFIVRTLIVGTSWCNFAVDGTVASYDSFPFSSGISTGFGSGRGTFVVPAGASLTLTHGMDGEPCTYFIEGTYIQP